MLDPSHFQRVNKLYQKYKPVRITQKEHLLIWNSETTQNLNIYLYNYQTETAIFLATKHEKAIMAYSYLNFKKIFPSFWTFGQQYYKNESIHLNSWHLSHKKQIDSLETQVIFADILAWTWNIWYGLTENTSKQQAMVAFVRNCLFKMTLTLFLLVNFCRYNYGANSSD